MDTLVEVESPRGLPGCRALRDLDKRGAGAELEGICYTRQQGHLSARCDAYEDLVTHRQPGPQEDETARTVEVLRS